MSSSSNDPHSPPQGLNWAHREPAASAPETTAPVAKPAAPKPEPVAKHEPPQKMRGVFAKQSMPPPPAGRPPQSIPKPAGAIAPQLPSLPPVPSLPPDLNTLDDPIADLFSAPPSPPEEAAITAPPPAVTTPEIAFDAPALRSFSVHDEPTVNMRFDREDPTLVPSGDEAFGLRKIGGDPIQVALAKTMLSIPAHEMQEIMAADTRRDARSEAPGPVVSARPVAAAKASASSLSERSSLDGLVFDPDQSVARRLGEVSIDGDVGTTSQSDALRDLPLPQVPKVVVPDHAELDALPVKSMRSAMLIIALVLVSGGIATLVSLGVLGGTPQAARREAQKEKAALESTKPVEAKTPAAPSAATNAAVEAAAVVATPEPARATPAPQRTPAPQAELEPVAAPTPVVAPVAEPEPLVDNGAATEGTGTEAEYRAALASDPRDHHAMEGLVRVLLARGEGRAAVDFAEQMVKRRPKRAAYRIMLGQALTAAGDRVGAKVAYEEALAIEPDNRDALRLLGR